MATVRHLGLFPAPFSDNLCPNMVNSQDIVLTSSNTEMNGSLSENTRVNAWMSLEQAMAFVWRVKSWKITHSSSYTFIFDGEVSETRIIEFEQTIQGAKVFSFPSENPKDESEIVCGLKEASFGTSIFSVGSVGGSLSFNAGNISYHEPSNSFRPDIFTHQFGSIYFYPSIFDPIAFALDDRPAFAGETGSVSLQIEAVGYNQSFPIYIYAFAPQLYSSSFNQTIVAHEYWPYDPGDGGGPIYDSTTGAQLRPFPN